MSIIGSLRGFVYRKFCQISLFREKPDQDGLGWISAGHNLGSGWLIASNPDRFPRLYRKCCVCGRWYCTKIPATVSKGRLLSVRMHCDRCKIAYLRKIDIVHWYDPNIAGPARPACRCCGRPVLAEGLHACGIESGR